MKTSQRDDAQEHFPQYLAHSKCSVNVSHGFISHLLVFPVKAGKVMHVEFQDHYKFNPDLGCAHRFVL